MMVINYVKVFFSSQENQRVIIRKQGNLTMALSIWGWLLAFMELLENLLVSCFFLIGLVDPLFLPQNMM
jgi:hypothetical protein